MSVYNESICSCWKDGDSTLGNGMLFCVSIQIDHNLEESLQFLTSKIKFCDCVQEMTMKEIRQIWTAKIQGCPNNWNEMTSLFKLMSLKQ